MKLLQIEDDVHADLKLLKEIKTCKTISDTIRFALHHAGYTAAFFDRMRDLGVERQ